MQDLGYAGGGLFGFGPLFLFEVFADGGNGFGGVTGVGAGGVEFVLVPEAAGQAFGSGEFALTLDEQRVYFGNGGAG